MYIKGSIETYLNDLAARKPAPGGGSAASRGHHVARVRPNADQAAAARGAGRAFGGRRESQGSVGHQEAVVPLVHRDDSGGRHARP